MSSEIKNTLFRFVSMRAPELSDENDQQKRFVFREFTSSFTNTNQPFDDAVANRASNISKWQAMLNVTFTPLEEADIKSMSASLTKFGVWIARNKHSFSLDELITEKNKVTSASTQEGLSANGLSDENLNTLWNNLFYQTITQKNFYAKEAIMQLLIANHVYKYADYVQAIQVYLLSKKPANEFNEIDLEKIKYIVNAKVVLPKELFFDNNVVQGSSQKTSGQKLPQPIATALQQFIEIDEKKEKLKALKELKKEIDKIERNYRFSYEKNKSIAYKDHQEAVKKLLQEYNEDVNTAKDDWCQNRDSTTPYNAEDPCQKIPVVPSPDIPVFEYVHNVEEASYSDLSESLSAESYKLLLDTIGVSYKLPDPSTNPVDPPVVNTNAEGTSYSDGFGGINTTILGEINTTSGQIVETAPVSNPIQYVSVGGVLVPVASTSALQPYEAQGCKATVGNFQYYYLMMGLPAGGEINLAASYYTLNNINYSFTKIGVHNNAVVLKSSTPLSEPLGLTIQFNIFLLDGTLCTYEAETIDSFRDFMAITLIDDTPVGNIPPLSNTQNNTTNPTFVPTGFGVKQLGIADYKKVEQSIQGYVEGEVAHIENIMAREYKEKATRRLVRSENTTTSSSETEKEQLSDTTTTNRFEMQTEVAKVLQESNDFHAEASFQANWGGQSGAPSFTLGASTGLATHSSREESNRMAQTQSQEITQRAMERMVTKIKEERIEKIIEEFEENNKHGFDNTKGDKHVVGVYRWVDKIYKNRIYNYGKRLMFEFMIPEPGKLHQLGITENKNTLNDAVVLTKPKDPRIETVNNLSDYTKVDDNTAKYWGGIFNIEITTLPDEIIKISHSFSDSTLGVNEGEGGFGRWSGAYSNNDCKIDSKYSAVKIEGNIKLGTGVFEWGQSGYLFKDLFICGIPVSEYFDLSVDNIRDKITISGNFWDARTISGSLIVTCHLTAYARKQWQQETFKAIIDAYEDALEAYNNKLAEEKAKGNTIAEINPGFYRQIENMILRKNCISYLIDRNQNAYLTYGISLNNGLNTFGGYEVNVGKRLDDYAAFVKFFEQAFEWNLMSYNFYPYYWGGRNNWAKMYQYDSNDPIFRNFMQAGMARVIVTVRPGFEDAVRFYMQTGQIWNGGEVPVIDEPLYLSIVDELREPAGKPEGKAWWTRIPTSLTILQAQTIGLNVLQPLPYNEDTSEFEDPSTVPHTQGLDLNPVQLGIGSATARIVGKIFGNENTQAKITITDSNNTLKGLTYCDENGNYELNNIAAGNYELNLDANNNFPATTHQVTVGSKLQQVVLASEQLLEVNITVAPL